MTAQEVFKKEASKKYISKKVAAGFVNRNALFVPLHRD